MLTATAATCTTGTVAGWTIAITAALAATALGGWVGYILGKRDDT